MDVKKLKIGVRLELRFELTEDVRGKMVICQPFDA